LFFSSLEQKCYEFEQCKTHVNVLYEAKASLNSAVKKIANRRVKILIQRAKDIYAEKPDLAQSYVSTARKIAMGARIRLPAEYKRQICKGCNVLLVPGRNSRVRIKQTREPHVTVTCLKCGRLSRYPLKTKKKGKSKIEQNNNQNETSC
jgi:ribonuclease P protein subunit RPR2